MDNRPEWGKGCSRGCLLPQRVVVAIMSFLAIICAYTHRVSISHVITKLVVPINRTNDEVDHEDVCPVDEDTSTETPLFFLCTSRPDQHPCIKPEELSYLTEALGERSQGKSPLPWKELLLSVPLLALVISQIGHDWGYYVMITCLPKYIANVIRFSIRSNGFVTALPFLAMFICTNLAGLLADYIIKSGKMSITNERKLYTFISAFGPGAFTVLASYAGCNKILVIGLFTFAMFLMGFYYSGQKLTPMDMSPSYAGTLMAICNGLGSLAGLASPPVVGYLTPNATMNEWRVVFWLGFVIFIISAIVFAVIGTAEVQPYDPAYTGEKKKG
ncbi:putative inorganic phosphate cotransporter isoform X3 [Drosophila albomicans]|uniref:Inorganic phosphate cotransporter isoform X3 n=1 Tax=Drosophila albomicans TaxID=7291 RepID=A0A6P8W743_DROAB|nr:putative inorganic phosphate cotransporter isoform X3 [Drosophila albomicans]